MAALAAIFGAFPGMWRRVDRERYLPMVADDLGVRLDVRHSSDMRRDIEAMLRVCAAHWGGVSARHAIAPQARWAARDSAVAGMKEPPVLVARLQPEADTGTFWLQVYLQWGSSAPELTHADTSRSALSRAPLVLDRLQHRLLHERDDLRGLPLTIEFVLPYEMLSEPVDEWTIGMPPYRLGHTYPVVVRTPDRHADTKSRAAWMRKWRWVSTYGRDVDPDAVYWCPTMDAEQLPSDAASERRVCHILPAPPGPVRDSRSRLHAALAAGVPAILWSREVRDPANIEHQLVHRSRECPVQQLAHLVLDLRIESDQRDADPEHIGNGLTLLWDDYVRSPPMDMDLVIP
jgi:hypothetical protein